MYDTNQIIKIEGLQDEYDEWNIYNN
jgi:hypothetical protein